MGIYPDVRWEKVDEHHMTRVTTTPGLVVREMFSLMSRIEERDDCFCCSCPEGLSGRDLYCRNHGHYGKRPCEIHAMPGSPDEESGDMPASVQAEIARQRGESA